MAILGEKGSPDAAGAVENQYSWKERETGMIVTCHLKYYPSHEAVEWVLHFTNSSDGLATDNSGFGN